MADTTAHAERALISLQHGRYQCDMDVLYAMLRALIVVFASSHVLPERRKETCVQVPTLNGLVSVVQCSGGDDGVFSIVLKTPYILPAPYWRVRVVGPVIRMLRLDRAHNDARVWHTNATLCGGKYYLDASLVFTNYVPARHRYNCLSTTTLSLIDPPFSIVSTLNCSYEFGWRVRESTSDGIHRALARTRIQMIPNTTLLSEHQWNAALEYRHTVQVDATGVLSPKSVVFVGDSHMRNIYNDLLRLRGLKCPISISARKTVCGDSTGAFKYVPLGLATDVIPFEGLHEFRLLVVNTGQWAASYVPKTDAITPYRKELRDLLKALLRQSVRILFISTNFGPLSNLLVNCPPKDARNDPTIAMLNMWAREVVDELRNDRRSLQSYNMSPAIRFVDHSDLVEPIADLSDDWCHFSGVVGEAIARRLWPRIASAIEPNSPRKVLVR